MSKSPEGLALCSHGIVFIKRTDPRLQMANLAASCARAVLVAWCDFQNGVRLRFPWLARRTVFFFFWGGGGYVFAKKQMLHCYMVNICFTIIHL